MTEQELERAAKLARDAGDYDLADKLELAATTAHRQKFDEQWLDRWENDTWDLF